MEEFEIKFLEINVPELEKKLTAIGARKVAEYDYTRTIFYFPGGEKRGDWVRLRTDGKETTLTYKKFLTNGEVDGMREIEVGVENYDKTFELIKAMGLSVDKREKNKRTRYEKDDVTYDIDFWPELPPYLEIESVSYERVKEAARELGFDPEQGMIGTAGTVYAKYGIDIAEYSEITFDGLVKK